MVPYSTPVPLDRHVRFPLTESAPPANCGPGVADGHNRPLELPVVGVQFGRLRFPVQNERSMRRTLPDRTSFVISVESPRPSTKSRHKGHSRSPYKVAVILAAGRPRAVPY